MLMKSGRLTALVMMALAIGGGAVLSACDQTPPAQPTPTITAPTEPTAPISTRPPATQITTRPTGAPPTGATRVAMETSVSTPEVAPTLESPDALARDLAQGLAVQIRGTATAGGSSDPDTGLSGAYAFKLTDDGDVPLYAAHSTGLRSFDPEQNHFLVVYERRNEGWNEVARVEMEEPDILEEGMVRRVALDDENAWIEVGAGVGAHGSTYHIFRYSGGKLEELVSVSNSIPGAGDLKDVNGDGTPEVIVNESDAYVFCYACGVRYISFDVQRWDGSRLELVELREIATGPEPAAVRDANNRAIALADGELWKDALAAIEEARTLAPDSETIEWNAALINLTSTARRDNVVDNSYPLLARIFYGDYDAAVESIREYSPEELFHPLTPLIKGTAAEGYEENLSKWIEQTATLALRADPERAGAHFFRGWARWRANPESDEAVADFKRATELAPNEELFGFVAAYVTNE